MEERGREKTAKIDPTSVNKQPDSADKPPIPQPATDGFPSGGEDLTSRVPGETEEE